MTHEAIVDSVWDTSLQKLLLKRFPNATPEEIEKAHAFSYGGCIIQDMGYYPFGSHLFSDLTHYVRSGDFIQALLRESQDLDEYAFALGALAHYAADNNGHRLAINPGVPLLYPKLGTRIRPTVTYWDDHTSHMRTEFGLDVLQVAGGHYAPNQYHKFIGFQVSKPVLERAFLDTYGIELKDVFKSLDLALGTYRFAVSSVIPSMVRVAWDIKKDQLTKETPGLTRKKFLYNHFAIELRKRLGNRIPASRRGDPHRSVVHSHPAQSGTPEIAAVPSAHARSGKTFHGEFQRHRGYLQNSAYRRRHGPIGIAES